MARFESNFSTLVSFSGSSRSWKHKGTLSQSLILFITFEDTSCSLAFFKPFSLAEIDSSYLTAEYISLDHSFSSGMEHLNTHPPIAHPQHTLFHVHLTNFHFTFST